MAYRILPRSPLALLCSHSIHVCSLSPTPPFLPLPQWHVQSPSVCYRTPEPSPSSLMATALPQEASTALVQAQEATPPQIQGGPQQPHQVVGAGTKYSRCGAAFAGTGRTRRAGRSNGSTSAVLPVLGLRRIAACWGGGEYMEGLQNPAGRLSGAV